MVGNLAGGKNKKKSDHEELSNLSGILRRVTWYVVNEFRNRVSPIVAQINQKHCKRNVNIEYRAFYRNSFIKPTLHTPKYILVQIMLLLLLFFFFIIFWHYSPW